MGVIMLSVVTPIWNRLFLLYRFALLCLLRNVPFLWLQTGWSQWLGRGRNWEPLPCLAVLNMCLTLVPVSLAFSSPVLSNTAANSQSPVTIEHLKSN